LMQPTRALEGRLSGIRRAIESASPGRGSVTDRPEVVARAVSGKSIASDTSGTATTV
jgi:hypothetical protein